MRDCHYYLVSDDEYWSHTFFPEMDFFPSRLYILSLYENNPVNLMPFLFSVNYSTAAYYSMLRSFILVLFDLRMSLPAIWLAGHIVGIALGLFLTRFLWPSMSEFPSGFVSHDHFGSGLYVFVLGIFLLLPSSALVLSLRLLDFFWKYLPPRPVRRTSRRFKFVRVMFVRIGSLIHAHLPSPPRWFSNASLLPVDEIGESNSSMMKLGHD